MKNNQLVLGGYKLDFKQQLDSPEILELYIYDDVKGDTYSWWSGEVEKSETSQNYFRETLSQYPDIKEIKLYINSAGGSVIEGYGIFNQLKRHPAHKTAYVDGFANSIASIIVMACQTIIMWEGGTMGVHNISMGCFGNASLHRKVAEDLERMMEGNRQVYLSRSNGKITEAKLIELLDNETMLTAKECLEYGFCDEIDTLKPDKVPDPTQLSHNISALEQQLNQFKALSERYTEFSALHEQVPPIPPAPSEPEKPLKPAPTSLRQFFRIN